MATWPSGNKAATTTTDADADSISGARVDINKTVSNLNDVIDMFDMSTLADDRILVYDSASATFKVEDNATFTGDLNGNPLYDSTGDVVVQDKMVVYANSTDDRNISLGDETFGPPNYQLTNVKIDGLEERWAWLTLDEFSDSTFKNSVGPGNFTNPLIISRVQGGTPSAPVGLLSGRRILGIQSTVGYDDDGAGTNYVLPTSANFRFQAEVTENQRNTARGTKVYFDTIANGSTSTTRSIEMQGNRVEVAPTGDGILGCGATLTIEPDSELIIKKHAREYFSTSQTGTYSVDYNDGEWVEIDASADITMGLPTNLTAGRSMKVMVLNTSGSNITLNMHANFIGTAASYTIGAGNRTAFEIECWDTNYITTLMFDNQ